LAPVEWTEIATSDDGPLIAGRRAGSGPLVFLLHGGGNRTRVRTRRGNTFFRNPTPELEPGSDSQQSS